MNEAKRIKIEVLQPILSDDLLKDTPLIEVYIGTIKDTKSISKIVVELNHILPIPQLLHLKRIRNKDVILFPVETNIELNSEDVFRILKQKGVDVNLLEEKVRKIKVAEIPPKIRKQYEIVQKYWPCNFHSNKYLEKLSTNSLFSTKELDRHKNFMRIAIEVAKSNKSQFGVVVVDPKIDAIMAVGFNQTDQYPYKHSFMVAIENVAKTQRKVNNQDTTKLGIPLNILKLLKQKYPEEAFRSRPISSSAEGPYLCTGYAMYSTHEPCITCAMALVHCRVKRVFFGRTQTKGALGTLCKIHVVENLNHHYEAFGGLLEHECKALL